VFQRMLIVSGMLIAGSLFLASASRSEPALTRRSLSELPHQVGIWVEDQATEFDQKTLEVLGVDDYVNRVYLSPKGNSVGFYVGYYFSQRQGDTIHSPLNCLPGAGWNPIKKDVVIVDFQPESISEAKSNNLGIRINQIVIQKGLDKQVVLYWYQSHGRVIASEYLGKIYTVIDALRTNRTDAALVRVISSVHGLEEKAEREAEQNAQDFVKSIFPLLSQYLPN
jgi:EpsI family protein